MLYRPKGELGIIKASCRKHHLCRWRRLELLEAEKENAAQRRAGAAMSWAA
jgi:hypothetical protein